MNEMVSVIVPVYNVEEYVEHCIQSVVSQTYTNWELILVDDGSDDASGKICEDYAGKYDNISYYRIDHSGVSAARNHGMEYAKGEFFLFADSDDWLADNMLETLLKEGDGADMTVCGVYYVTGSDAGFEYQSMDILRISEKKVAKDLYYDILCRSSTLWNKLIKREIIGDLKFDVNKTYGEDMVFVTSLLSKVRSAILIPDPLYYYNRYREGNVVSEGLSRKTLEFLDNSLEVYYITARDHDSSCGLHRLCFAVKRIMKMAEQSEGRKFRKYIRRCGRAFRKTSIKDRIAYTKDGRFKIKRRKLKYLFFLFPYFPNAVFKYGGTDVLWGIKP